MTAALIDVFFTELAELVIVIGLVIAGLMMLWSVLRRNLPASVTHPTHASDPVQVGTTGRLDVKTAQTGAQHSNEGEK